MKSVTLKLIPVTSLAEIFQSVDIKFSFVNKKMEQVTVPAKCRDFLGDCIFSRRYKKAVSIYGFSYNYTQKPFDDCRFSLKFPNKETMTNFINNINYLHEREKQAGVKLTTIFNTDKPNTLVVEGSNYWINSVWKISLYTFYLKLISYKTINDVKAPENDYISRLTPEIEAAMLSKIKGRKLDHFPDFNTNKVHNYHGFYSMIRLGKQYNPVTTAYVLGDLV